MRESPIALISQPATHFSREAAKVAKESIANLKLSRSSRLRVRKSLEA
ncbi:MAG: hypothetical protein QOC81_34 [Thermoanaerobaculia bacterium]|jgi:hypothetical protein|nr:hypothetical protein [Thermoanaerobaculia bacterium]